MTTWRLPFFKDLFIFHTSPVPYIFGGFKIFLKNENRKSTRKISETGRKFQSIFFNLKKWSFPWFHFKVKSMAVWIVHLPLEIHFLLFMVRVKMADSGQRYANRWNGEGVVKMKTPFTEKPASRQDFLSRTHIGYTSASFVKCWRLSWSALMFRPESHLPGRYQRLCRHRRR